MVLPLGNGTPGYRIRHFCLSISAAAILWDRSRHWPSPTHVANTAAHSCVRNIRHFRAPYQAIANRKFGLCHPITSAVADACAKTSCENGVYGESWYHLDLLHMYCCRRPTCFTIRWTAGTKQDTSGIQDNANVRMRAYPVSRSATD